MHGTEEHTKGHLRMQSVRSSMWGRLKDKKTEKQASLIELEANSSLSDLVSALNVIGVTPMDLIAILQAWASAGSLQAEIEVI